MGVTIKGSASKVATPNIADHFPASIVKRRGWILGAWGKHPTMVGTATFCSVVSVGKVVSRPSCSTCRSCSAQGSKLLQDADRWRVMVYRHVSSENRLAPPFAK